MVRILALIFTLLLTGCSGDAPQLARSDPVPVFTLDRLTADGGVRPLTFPGTSDDRLPGGRVVAIRFWADWCPFCAPEMKAIEPIFRRYRKRGLTILAVNVRQDRETARAFMKKLGLTYDVLLDRDGRVARSYGVMAIPTTFFVDHEGRLLARILGEADAGVFEGIVLESMGPEPVLEDDDDSAARNHGATLK